MSDSKLINFYTKVKKTSVHNPNFETHRIHIPFRMLCCCSSGSGKSNYILNLLYEFDSTFHRIIVITKAPEPLYDLLCEKLKDRVEIYYEGNLPEFEALEPGKNGIVIFDDMILTPDSRIGEMFIRGRKLHYSSIYISQSFYQTPKIIRQNCNLIALGRGIAKRDLRMILSEYSIGISIEDLSRMYFEVTKTPMYFMLIDLTSMNIRRNIKDIIVSI